MSDDVDAVDIPAPEEMKPLEMSAPPWWEAWQRHATGRPMTSGQYDAMQHGYGAGYEQLLGELEKLERDALFRRITTLSADLARHNARTRGGRRVP